jgi:ABC-type sugar transport system permease subunit
LSGIGIDNSIQMRLKWVSFVLPLMIFYILVVIVPFVSSIVYSFTDWNGISSDFVGFENYLNLFKERKVVNAFKNTAIYSIFITVFQNILGLFLAVIMDRKFKTGTILKMMLFIPVVFSELVVCYIWGFILEPNNGVLNVFLSNAGLEFFAKNWLGDPSIAIWMIVLVSVWHKASYTMIIYIAGLQTIDLTYYEASEIDGANAISKFKHITFPLIAPAITINVTLCTIGTLSIFQQIYALTGGGPGYSTHSAASMIYELGFGEAGRWGFGTAMSVVLFIIIFTLTTTQSKFLRSREVDI